jgi:hypothetical protein
MTLHPAFGLGHSAYNPFLFAVVGEEELGIPLTVLTALTRLGIDPWEEAARLSNLPKDVAARALAKMIAALPRRHDTGSEALASRLVDLLPAGAVPVIPAVPVARRAASVLEPEKAKSRLAIALPWVALALAAIFLFLYLQADNKLEPGTQPGGKSEQYNR